MDIQFCIPLSCMDAHYLVLVKHNFADECEDLKPAKWCKKKKKQCKKSSISKQCKKTCDKCDDEPPKPENCKDKKSKKFCSKQKKANKCSSKKNMKNCKKTCGHCPAYFVDRMKNIRC